MDVGTCLEKMRLVGVLAFATVDSEGAAADPKYQCHSL